MQKWLSITVLMTYWFKVGRRDELLFPITNQTLNMNELLGVWVAGWNMIEWQVGLGAIIQIG